jgi:E3 ubiquitin-protein ligase Topors
MEIRRRMVQERDHPQTQGQKPMRSWGQNHKELLPSPPPAALRMDEDPADHVAETTALTIKGAARDTAETKRLTLLERLAKAKAEGAVKPIPSPVENDIPNTDVDMKVIKGRGIRARIQLKIKLESEKKQFRHNVNESKAQALRHLLLESKARREAAETDLTLKRLDMIDRQREVRRRLMVLKMMAAETDQERRARELREKLLARKAMLKAESLKAT